MFFKDLYQRLSLNIFEYAFEEHDETVAYSLSIPFVSTFVFAAVMKHQDAPGTTFKRHMAIAKGVLNEDDFLLQEILFNPRTPAQVEGIRTELNELLDIISRKDAEGMHAYLTKIREKNQITDPMREMSGEMSPAFRIFSPLSFPEDSEVNAVFMLQFVHHEHTFQ